MPKLNYTAVHLRQLGLAFKTLSESFESVGGEECDVPAPEAARTAQQTGAEAAKALKHQDPRAWAAFSDHQARLQQRFGGDMRLVLRHLPPMCEELAKRSENGWPRMEAPLELLKSLPQ